MPTAVLPTPGSLPEKWVFRVGVPKRGLWLRHGRRCNRHQPIRQPPVQWIQNEYSRFSPCIMLGVCVLLLSLTSDLKTFTPCVISHKKTLRIFRNNYEITKEKKPPSPALQNRLSELEKKAAQKGIHIHYDLLEAAGLKLKRGICKINGEYHIFVDKRKSFADRIDFLRDYLDNPLPDDVPDH